MSSFNLKKCLKLGASLKLLSTSSPTMTNQTAIPTTPNSSIEKNLPTTSKSRQKKFERHFPTVGNDEKVLNYYSCALIGDILLQGHLYITKNYFAFYSNVFGYVTKLLIPMLTVDKITKEKTARIIPNAVGISIGDEKHVFGSLMSRDNTYKFMIKIWELSQVEESNVEPEILNNPEILEIAASESDSSETKEMESEKENTAQFKIIGTNSRITCIKTLENEQKQGFKHIVFENYKSLLKMPKQTLILLAATFLLLLLFLSASILLFRINKIHDKYLTLIEDHQPMTTNEIFNRILRFSSNLHSNSADSINNLIDLNLDEISKISKNLETLSSILMPRDSNDAKDDS